MKLLGKKIVLGESAKRNLFLLPGLALLGFVLAMDSRFSRETGTPLSGAEAGLVRAATALPTIGTNHSGSPLALGDQKTELP